MAEPGLRLGGRPESVRDPGRQDLHDGVESILGTILAQVGALRRQAGGKCDIMYLGRALYLLKCGEQQ